MLTGNKHDLALSLYNLFCNFIVKMPLPCEIKNAAKLVSGEDG